MLSTGGTAYPTLINGVAWWPETDVYDVTRSMVFRTTQFAWATELGGGGLKVVTKRGGADGEGAGTVVAEGPDESQPGLRFTGPKAGPGPVECIISRQ
jgi:hypothetical protein